MAKLGPQMVKKVNAADDDPFAPLPKGYHKLKLTKVESGKSKNSGKNMWTWHFKAIEPGPQKELREYSVFDQEWKFKQIFGAFGVPADTDTDELVGKTVIAEIGWQPDRKDASKMRHCIVGYPDQATKPELFVEDGEDEANTVLPGDAEVKTPAAPKRGGSVKAEDIVAPDF